MKAESRVRISKPPPLGGVIPVLIPTVLPFSVVTVILVKFASTFGAIGAGNQVSSGTVKLVLMARSSAQSLANAIA